MAVVALLLAACSPASRPQKPQEAPSRVRVGELEQIDISFPGILLLKPDHYMGSYDQLMVDPIIISYKKGSKKLSTAEFERLKAHLRDAMAIELVSVQPSQVVTEPGPCVLRMQVAFVDLDLPDMAPSTGSNVSYVTSHGSVTLVHELRDSVSGTVLLRYMGRRNAGAGSGVGTVSRWSRLTRMFDEMLADLQEGLVESVSISVATSGPLASCGGQVLETIEEVHPGKTPRED
jgi:hypothetical protein